MTGQEQTPYDQLEETVTFLLDAHKKLQDQLLEAYKHIRENQDRIAILEKKLSPENPGDINHLYQNWDKH